jgi:serine/threonine-protein kinase HipA
MSRNARIFYDDSYAGVLAESDDGYTFSYEEVYLNSPEAMAVSLTLPLQSVPFHDKSLFPFFDGLIPEGWLLDIAHRSWKIDIRDRMGLLLACCQDCIGMVSVVPGAGEDQS